MVDIVDDYIVPWIFLLWKKAEIIKVYYKVAQQLCKDYVGNINGKKFQWRIKVLSIGDDRYEPGRQIERKEEIVDKKFFHLLLFKRPSSRDHETYAE